MLQKFCYRVLLLGVLAVGAACQPATATLPPPASTATLAATVAATNTPAPTIAVPTEPAVSLTPGPTVEAAVTDLAKRLAIPVSGVTLIKIELAEMPLPDLGCPADAATPLPDSPRVTGQVIWLMAGKAEYLYHSDGQLVVFCGQVNQPDTGGGDS